MDHIYENDKKNYIDIQDKSILAMLNEDNERLEKRIEALEKRIEALEKNQNRYQ